MRVVQESVPQAQALTMRVLDLSLAAFDGPVHMHPMLELTCIARGSGLRFVGDTVEPFAPGDVVLVAPQVAHAWWSSASRRVAGAAQATVMQLHDTPALQGLPEWAAGPGVLLSEAAAGWALQGPLAAEVAAALPALSSTQGLAQLGQALALLARIAAPEARRWRRPLGLRQRRPEATAAAGARRVDALLTWVRDHLQEDLSAAAAARQLHVTPAAFSRSFKRLVGRSFTDYVNDLRIAEARLLLRRTDRPISEVAAACGFATLSNFNAQFRRRVGVSPREDRRG
ncbi:helix-turn-helix domain-containing protein [Ideonella sp. 4Y16]|uniref:Helix-turn-helix domain-containing protein n=1 Tax=Ideonella alba TaxID=2824118 RepID=A0A940Y518_9BURK|nr:AraC family transcriptional regulator [Ideonella alba]MBQ0929917.1 helix-turn-helix domain-containing protein [Ideonella alba]MBQ0942150.1 helix-turn-helix domain-containing protein [Ideonella alba]